MKAIRVVLLIIVLSMMGATSYAQSSYAHLQAALDAQEPQPLSKKLVKKDLNDNPVSVVLVSSAISGLQFDGNVMEVTESQDIDNDNYIYYVYITKGTKRLTIKHNSYVQTLIEFPRTVDSRELWSMTVIGIEAQNLVERKDIEYKRDVNIKIEPWAKLYIDNVLSTEVKSLEEGVHYISTRYTDKEYAQKVNIQNDGQEIDARIGGEVVIKNAKEVSIIPVTKEPEPNQICVNKKKYDYDGLLGQYRLTCAYNSYVIASKEITIDPREQKTFILIPSYIFLMYHGSNKQPIGASLGYCGRVGFMIHAQMDLIKKINTPYGEVEFGQVNNETGKKVTERKNTIGTLSVGPMFRVYRSLYVQAGAGLVRYLYTSEPNMLTVDYSYKNGVSTNMDLFYRFGGILVIGAGYSHQFVKSQFKSSIVNQITFSIGFTIPTNLKL